MSFRKPSAMDEIEAPRLVAGLIPFLLGKGLDSLAAVALANNTVLAFLVKAQELAVGSPKELLNALSLDEIAEICCGYKAWSESGAEGGFNENYEETINASR